MRALRILVVEDDVMVGPLLAEMLEDLGHIVCAVEIDAAKAAVAAARCHPDLMIVDIGMGDVGSVTAVNDVLRDGLAPHVFVTSDIPRDLALGPEAVLIQKPFRGSDIVAAIELATEEPPWAAEARR